MNIPLENLRGRIVKLKEAGVPIDELPNHVAVPRLAVVELLGAVDMVAEMIHNWDKKLKLLEDRQRLAAKALGGELDLAAEATRGPSPL